MSLYWRCCRKNIKLDDKCPTCNAPRGESVLWCRFYVGKIEYRKSTDTHLKSKAEQMERLFRSHVESSAPKRTRNIATVGTLREKLIEEVMKFDVRPERKDDLIGLFKPLLRILGEDTDAAVVCDIDVIHTYIDKRLEEGRGGQTIKRETQALARALRFAGFEVPANWPNGTNTPKLKSKKTEQSKKQRGRVHRLPVLISWFEALRTGRSRRSKHPGEAYDMALLAFLTGLRHEELYRLTPEWVEAAPADCSTEFILRLPDDKTKDDDERVVGLSAMAHEIIKRRDKGPMTPIFSGEKHKGAYRSASKRIGYHLNIHLRDMRKNHLTIGGYKTSDASAVQSAAGHSDLKTTNIYMGSTIDRVTSVAAAVAEEFASKMENRNTRTGTHLQDIDIIAISDKNKGPSKPGVTGSNPVGRAKNTIESSTSEHDTSRQFLKNSLASEQNRNTKPEHIALLSRLDRIRTIIEWAPDSALQGENHGESEPVRELASAVNC
jgi:integrase